MAKEDFAVGLLQGLYNSGVGNPEVNERRRQNSLQEAFLRQQMMADAQERGMMPAQGGVDPQTMNKVLEATRGILFPGSGGPALPTAFVPDPNARVGYVNTEGELSETPEPNSRRLTPKQYTEALLNAGKRNRLEEFHKAQATASAERENAKQREDFITGFRDKLSGSPAMKDYLKIKQYAGNIEDAVKDPGAFGDLTMLYSYMRAIEPDSVVREGDQRLFQAAGSLSARTANALNRLATGETLTTEQRNEILKYTKSLKKNAFSSYDTLRKGTYKQAQRNSLPIEEIDPLHDERFDDPIEGQDQGPTALPSVGGTFNGEKVLRIKRIK